MCISKRIISCYALEIIYHNRSHIVSDLVNITKVHLLVSIFIFSILLLSIQSVTATSKLKGKQMLILRSKLRVVYICMPTLKIF